MKRGPSTTSVEGRASEGAGRLIYLGGRLPLNLVTWGVFLIVSVPRVSLSLSLSLVSLSNLVTWGVFLIVSVRDVCV